VSYKVALRPAAQRQLERLRGPVSIAVHGALLKLGDDPRPPGAVKLAGASGLWRLRVRLDGRPWRLIYRVDDKRRIVVVARIARRDEGTYRGL
jgi:mRNA interferase RelE/StbE